jgi:hypothetical protein
MWSLGQSEPDRTPEHQPAGEQIKGVSAGDAVDAPQSSEPGRRAHRVRRAGLLLRGRIVVDQVLKVRQLHVAERLDGLKLSPLARILDRLRVTGLKDLEQLSL